MLTSRPEFIVRETGLQLEPTSYTNPRNLRPGAYFIPSVALAMHMAAKMRQAMKETVRYEA